ncbi:MAG: GmrSD restriction endonuclease domain-containing protein [Candidatus Dormibacteria bacterium]
MSAAITVSRQEYRVGELLRLKQQLQIDPSYQREGHVWSLERQQLLIDSVLNRFEIPQIYLHRLQPPKFEATGTLMYAVVDGRQRLETIWDFADGRFRLASDFALLDEEPNPTELDVGVAGRYGGMSFSDLEVQAPHLVYRFSDYLLPVAFIDTEDEQLIEELFFRLNEGVPLTPAEKRNRGFLLKDQVFPLVRTHEVLAIVKFPNRRQSHEDLLLRLLYLEASDVSADRVPDMKKRQLDDFAASLRPSLGETWTPDQEGEARGRLERFVNGVLPTLDAMQRVFLSADPLLSTVSQFLVYYLVMRELVHGDQGLPQRWEFEAFQQHMLALRGIPAEDMTADDLDLLEEFGEPIQGSTTGSYFKRRAELLLHFLRSEVDLLA